jgi:riboflavin kinase/FMN adenylyltransferase|tara:strand:+ start:78 stop:1010 length:933 start_codon:yes stop_codon:yes gene_type:complete
MKTYNIHLDSLIEIPNLNLAIGNFDGVHIGHQKIIDKLIKDSKIKKYSSAVLSFNPHPRKFFLNDCVNFEIISEKKKISLLEKLGIDFYFSLRFNEKISSLSHEEFLEKIILDKLKTKSLVVGYDFKFGKDRKGDISFLKKESKRLNFNLEIIKPIKSNYNSQIYSSSIIRKSIQEGDMHTANQFLGNYWSMQGIVIDGDKNARKMNFPTANIIPHNQIHPRKGVYAIKVEINSKLVKGIANFGERPTFDGKKLLLEVHLFEFDEDIYGKELTVEFLTFIREEKKFDSFDLLKKQIQKDIIEVREFYLEK